MTENIDERFDSDGVELAYLAWAGDSPPVVFLHGMSATKDFWVSRSALRGGHRGLAYDARGHGDSGRSESYRFVDFGNDAIRIVDELCGEPVILVGHSLGAMTAAFVAAERPDLTRAVCLIEPPLYASKGLRDQQAEFEQRRVHAGKSVSDLIAFGFPEVQARGLAKLDGRAIAQLLDKSAFEGWDTDDLLKNIGCPVLLEHGERDYGAGLAASHLYDGEVDRARSLIRDCTVVEINGSGHVPMVQRPDEFTRVVSDFIQLFNRTEPDG